MKLMPGLGLVLTLFTLSSRAQARFCIGGDLDELTVAQVHACQEKSDALRQAAHKQGVPADWHFVTVCDEGAWKALATLTGEQAKRMVQVDQSTNGKLRLTLVRGSRMQPGDFHQAEVLLSQAREAMPKAAERTLAPTSAEAPHILAARLPLPAGRQQ